jgi:very-short-patch-repair endonuclease
VKIASDVSRPQGASTSVTRGDEAIAGLAARQHGVVARRQLVRLGLSAKAIRHRARTGRLHLIHRGVSAVGHARLTQRGWWMAAVLAAGEGAVLSHRSAAALWGLGLGASGRVDVTVAKERRRPGSAIHEARLEPDEGTVRDGIPVTTVARTLLDLAATAPRRDTERALREAERRRLGDRASVAVLLERHRGRKGTATLRALLARATDGITKSELEEAFLTFLDDRRFSRPSLNVHVEGFECDCYWAAARTVVELDGRAFHDDDDAFEDDRARDRRLQAVGIRTMRVT